MGRHPPAFHDSRMAGISMDDAKVGEHIACQFRAALAMLRQAVELCPVELWLDSAPRNRFWHIAYHAVFYTHFYLHASEAEFRPWSGHQANSQYLGPRPWASQEPAPAIEPCTREKVLEYLELCFGEVAFRIQADALDGESGFSWLPFNRLETHLYSLRHLQHHTGQLTDRLRLGADVGVAWVRMA
jgi:hypothetical protein